jgi:DNA-directed RNA polymerase subunit RPC12/RpoP
VKVLENKNYVVVECPQCKSKLGVHLEDVCYNEIAHHCSAFETSCGACGKSIGIKQEDMPASWVAAIVPADF